MEVEPVLLEVSRETLNHCFNKAPDISVGYFGRDRNLHSSTFGRVTVMQNLTET